MSARAAGDRRPIRIAMVGDFDSIHARTWLRWVAALGHDAHAVCFYAPTAEVGGAKIHALRSRRDEEPAAPDAAAARSRGPALAGGLWRLAHAVRYRRAGLARALRDVAPDVVHAHYVVEHGFYAAVAGVRPLVVTGWGSDVLVAPEQDPVTRAIARWTLRRADAVTANNREMAMRMVTRLGAPDVKVHLITLGTDAWFSERWDASVNVRGRGDGALPVILSTRAHEPLYNVERIVRACGLLSTRGVQARLIVAHAGSQTAALRAQAAVAGIPVTFTGTVDAQPLRDLMTDAEVFVSVPSSDGTSVALLQAMAAGCFPVVADLPTQREWIADGENGLLTGADTPEAVAEALARALADDDLRRAAAARNRQIVAERGTNETQMRRLDALYRELVGR